MIYWYSGTGNSRYVAHHISRRLGNDKLCFIPYDQGYKHNIIDDYDSNSDNRSYFGMVFPIYAWGVPPVVIEWIRTLTSKEINGRYVYAVCTCGDEAGLAIEMLKKLLKRQGINLNAAFSVILPNNYVLMPGFSIDSKDVEERKLNDSHARLMRISTLIRNREKSFEVYRGKFAALKTRIVYPIFKSLGMQTYRWKVSEKCVGCGKCVNICPVDNISFKSDNIKEPKWSKHCLSCTACYHVCPQNAISYGNVTKGKGQYICPLE